MTDKGDISPGTGLEEDLEENRLGAGSSWHRRLRALGREWVFPLLPSH